jgi:hypothetical protein
VYDTCETFRRLLASVFYFIFALIMADSILKKKLAAAAVVAEMVLAL